MRHQPPGIAAGAATPPALDRLIVESADVGIVTFDRGLRYTTWNRFMEELLGIAGADRIGRTPEEMWSPDGMPFPGYVDILHRALAGEKIVLHEAKSHPHPNGNVPYGHVTAGPLRGDKDEIVGVIVTVHDITARKLAEDALRRHDQVMGAVSSVAHLLLGTALEDCAEEALGALGRAVEASRAYIFRFERRADEMRELQLWEWCADGVPSDPAGDATIEGSGLGWAYARLQRGEAVHGPVAEWPEEARAALTRSGIRSLAIVPIFVDGELWGDCGFDDCFSARRWSAAEVDALETAASVLGAAISRQRGVDALRESEIRRDHLQRIEAIGRLAGGIAHDFNNLLTVINGHLELVRVALPPGSKATDDVARIGDATERAVALARQLLTFSRREVTESREVDLNEVVRDVESMLRRLITADVEVVLRLSDCPVYVVVDPVQLQQVVVNLAVNARDAMPDGGRLAIETEIATSVKGLSTAVLRVTDTGTGIEPGVLDSVFEPFFTTKPRGEGVGLGLATAHGIVTGAGGSIHVDSELGLGTTFLVELPLVAPPRIPRDAGARLGSAAVDRGGGERVLLVEDERSLRQLAAAILGQRGYSVLVAGDGAEALEIARANAGAIDLLLTDVVMPRMSGRELADRLRAEQPDLPIVFMSGYTSEEIRSQPIPGSAFLQKAFSPEQLTRIVRETLDAGRSAIAG